ncbi:MAG TPA: glycoside hydrolase family 9 protein [Marinagarivorans sp.]
MRQKLLALLTATFFGSASLHTSAAPAPAAIDTAAGIYANQIGFLPNQYKAAVVPNTGANEFKLTDKASGKVVYNGVLSSAQAWQEAQETVKTAEFTGFNYPGEYQLSVDGVKSSFDITIKPGIYREALAGAIKYYYYNRNSAALEQRHAGEFHRPASHPDTIVYVDASAATEERPAGAIIESPKGWFDAGDYGKYIVNSNITVYTLLRALENNPALFASLDLNIPESNNALPDLLDEILWNLDWMETMQDTDGGLYHKLTAKNFEALAMPHLEYEPRYVVQKSTAATLGFAATMARASLVLEQYSKHLPEHAERYKNAALRAWEWAEDHPATVFEQPEGFRTGMYASSADQLSDEWAWASAELFALTGKKKYLKEFEVPKSIRSPEWRDVEALAMLSLANNPKTPKKLKAEVEAKLVETADNWVQQMKASGYGVAMAGGDFRWGSNGVAANKAAALFAINALAPNAAYLETAESLLDYLLGRNPNNVSYLTGFGERAIKAPHHRVSEADDVLAPVPGMLAGGPHTGHQDKDECERLKAPYEANIPAKAYHDHWCSYATNEVAINWNAGLVYTLAEMNRRN